MRKIFYESIVILLILLLSMPINMTVYATRNEDIHRLSIGLNAFFEVGDGDKLTERTGTSHMAFVEDMRNSAEGTLAMNVLGWIYGTGAEPDEEKYMKVLINIMKTHEMETAGEISD
ncbi:MAG: hypothetical protein IJY28_03725, partial [Clostridia bacterium]|nr:hypothetical protein [Clostridia bacterium]